MNQFFIRRGLIAGYIIALIIICFFAGYTYYNMQKVETEGRREEEILQSLKAVDNVLEDLQEIDARQRGYIISGNKNYRALYEQALKAITTDTSVLKQLAGRNGTSQLVNQLMPLVQREIDFTGESVRLKDAGAYDLALQRLQSGPGMNLMQDIRRQIIKMEDQGRIMLKKYGDSRRFAARQTTRLFIILSALFILFLLIFFWLERRQVYRLFRHELTQEVNKGIFDFKDILERISDGFIAFDKDWKYAYVNDRACELIGKKRADIIGKTIWEIYPQDTAREFYRAYSKAMETQEYVFLEAYYNEWNGWFENHIYPSPRGISIYFKDVTERKRTEQELGQATKRFYEVANAVKESEEKYRTLVEQATDGIFIADPDGKFIVVNSSGCRMSQYTENELGSMTIYDLAVREDLEKNPFRFEEMAREGGVRSERKMKKKDGSIIDVEVNAKFLSDGRFLAFIRDITDRKKAEELIRANTRQLDIIYNTTSDVLFLLSVEQDDQFRFQSVNKMFEKTTGRTSEEIIGKYVQDVIPPASLDLVLGNYKAAVQTGQTISWEEVSDYPSGQKTGIVSITPFFDEKRTCTSLVGSVHDITERKKAEEAIVESNERFKLVAKTTNDAIWEWGFTRNRAWGNDAHQHLYGLNLSDPVPNHEDWVKRIHPEDRERTIQSYHATLASSENVWIAEYRFHKQGEDWVTIYDRTYILRDKEGQPVRMMGSMSDITDRKKAEEEIKKAKELADKLIDSLPGVFYFYDVHGKFIRWNTQLETVTGYTGEEIANMHPTDFFEGEEKTYIIKRIEDVFVKGINDAEAHFVNKQGERVPYYFKAVLINYEGKPCLLGSGIDIAERKKVEEELRLSEKKYRSLVEQAADAIFIFNEQGLFEDVNSVTSQMLGYTREELTTMSLPEILFKEEIASDPIIDGLLSRGEPVIKRRNFKRRDGTGVPVEVHSKKLPDGRYLGIVRDLTERIEAERQLQQSFRQIRELTDHIQNIREEERAHIAREIHDELGQQLTVLKMDVSWLNKKVGENDEPVQKKLRSLTELLDGTVKTVRRISSELRPSLLDDLGLVAAMDWHLKEFEAHSGMETEFTEPVDEITISETVKTGLFRIFQESLTNVARHARARKVIVNMQKTGDEFILRIEDDGRGFNKLQVNNKRTLGILGMRERTTMMGGTYDISSAPGKGTVVLVSVPAGK